MTVDTSFVFYWIKACLGSTVMLFTCVHMCLQKILLIIRRFFIDDGISLLEESLADVMLSLDDVYILLCGDLSSRTSNEFPISQSGNVFTRPVEETPVRCSEDSVLNPYGKKVIEHVYRFWIECFEWSL